MKNITPPRILQQHSLISVIIARQVQIKLNKLNLIHPKNEKEKTEKKKAKRLQVCSAKRMKPNQKKRKKKGNYRKLYNTTIGNYSKKK